MTFPFVPLGNQWTHPTLEADADMHAKIDGPLNAARAYLLGWQQGLPQCSVAMRSAATSWGSVGSIMPWDTVVVDALGNYNNAGHYFACPNDGWYVTEIMVKQSAASTKVFNMQIQGFTGGSEPATFYETPYASGVALSACYMPPNPLPCKKNDVLFVTWQSTTTAPTIYTDGVNEACWWDIYQVHN